jgi:hypothetical protein
MNRRALLTLLGFSLIALADTPESRIPYFTHVRDIKVNSGDKLTYVVLDESVWRHARPDLQDLRLYRGENEVPYLLHVETSHTTTAHEPVRILNKGVVGGNTQLTLDLSLPEYDHVEFEIDAKDYIARVNAAGANDPNATRWTQLTDATFFNLASERLGENTTIRFATPSTFRYLRLTFSGPIKPAQVTSARHAFLQDDKAEYTKLNVTPTVTPEGRKTVATWKSDGKIPLERVEFSINASQVNFSRPTRILCDGRYIAGQEISRVRLNRQGRKIESEELALAINGARCKEYRIEIENGDDRPLAISSITPMLYERRVYFDPAGGDLKLYYGDEKLTAPTYDFAKFFATSDEAGAVRADISAEIKNAAYSGRPDDRPWSERNPQIMWAAMVLAVAGLGLWAIKGFKK